MAILGSIYWPPPRDDRIVSIIILVLILSSCQQVAGQQQQAPVVNGVGVQIIVPNLPPSHYQFWLKNHPLAFKEFESICSQLPNQSTDTIKELKHFQSLHANLSIQDAQYLTNLNYGINVLKKICSKIDVVMKSCWGYENNCQIIHLMPECYGSHLGQAKDDQHHKITWFNQADFGYVLERRREMNKYCSFDKFSNETVKSSLECTKYFRTCRGENLFIRFNLTKVGGNLIENPSGKKLIEKDDVGGWNCDLQAKRIQEESGQRGYLQSWFNELENYKLIEDSQPSQVCNETVGKQAFIIKLDSPINMYHYFCNFLNLYATFHLQNRFSEDNQIIIWDTELPQGKLSDMWSVFSRNPPVSIGSFDGKRVCFKRFVFTLLPRMVDGLYYNTTLIPGCSKTGLFDAFNKHVLHKFNINQEYLLDWHKKCNNKIIRVTLVLRKTPYRRILNYVDLKRDIQNSSDYQVQLVDFAEKDFKQQLKIVQNTDILVGIHGAGLTHTLFLPDWAALLEIHDCGDKRYHDLARLRGVSYFSPDHKEKVLVRHSPDSKSSDLNGKLAGDKFLDYLIKIDEFMPTLEKASDKVRRNRAKYFNDLEDKEVEEAVTLRKRGVESEAEAKQRAGAQHTEL